MSDEFSRGRAVARAHIQICADQAPSDSVFRARSRSAPDLTSLARMCEAVGDDARLRIFRQIAEAGLDGCDAGDIEDEDAVSRLIAAGVVIPLRVGRQLRYRAERHRLVEALRRLISR